MIYDKTKYSNTDKYPNKEDFEVHFVYQKGSVILNGVSSTKFAEWCHKNPLNNLIHEKIYDEERFKEYREKWNKKQAECIKRYKEELFKFYGLNNPIGEIIYAKAWEEGHSSGMEEVENCFDDLSDFVFRILENNSN